MCRPYLVSGMMVQLPERLHVPPHHPVAMLSSHHTSRSQSTPRIVLHPLKARWSIECDHVLPSFQIFALRSCENSRIAWRTASQAKARPHARFSPLMSDGQFSGAKVILFASARQSAMFANPCTTSLFTQPRHCVPC